jgi:hypothetical protein
LGFSIARLVESFEHAGCVALLSVSLLSLALFAHNQVLCLLLCAYVQAAIIIAAPSTLIIIIIIVWIATIMIIINHQHARLSL